MLLTGLARGKLVVFAKAPEPGEVKTRLARDIGNEAAAALARELILRTLRSVCGIRDLDRELWCSPSSEHPFFQECAARFAVGLHNQLGDDLGARMLLAAREALTSHGFVIIIGTDCPNYSADYIAAAARFLASDDDAVLGPAEDGGYVLIGLRRVHPALFTDIVWGGPDVLSKSLKRLARLGFRYHLLDTLWDVDRLEDLERYRSLSSTTASLKK